MKEPHSNLSGTKLRYLLAQNKKTGRDLAEYLSISQPQISRWVNGIKPVPKTHLKSISTFFGISIDELTKNVDEKYQVLYDMIMDLPNDERINFAIFILSTISTEGTRN